MFPTKLSVSDILSVMWPLAVVASLIFHVDQYMGWFRIKLWRLVVSKSVVHLFKCF